MDHQFSASLLRLYPQFVRVYGPYVSIVNDGRRHVVLTGPGVRRTISWPKAMMEVKLDRHLSDDEFVDHIDDDPTNDSYDNFQILTPSGNAMKSVAARGAEREMVDFICEACGGSFSKEARVVRHNQESQGKSGPFCSKSCAGRYSHPASVAKRKRDRA